MTERAPSGRLTLIIHVARVQTLTPEYTKFGLCSGVHRFHGNEVGLGMYSSQGILNECYARFGICSLYFDKAGHATSTAAS
jgi:hypothetical protein